MPPTHKRPSQRRGRGPNQPIGTTRLTGRPLGPCHELWVPPAGSMPCPSPAPCCRSPHSAASWPKADHHSTLCTQDTPLAVVHPHDDPTPRLYEPPSGWVCEALSRNGRRGGRMARDIAPHEAWVVKALTCLATSCMSLGSHSSCHSCPASCCEASIGIGVATMIRLCSSRQGGARLSHAAPRGSRIGRWGHVFDPCSSKALLKAQWPYPAPAVACHDRA
jgi:hypothetical protein